MSVQQNRHPFDLPVGRREDPCMKMEHLMKSSVLAIQRKEWETARKMLEYGVESNHIPAKLALAGLLIHTPERNIPAATRYGMAETLFREVLAVMELPEATEARVAMELSRLYSDYMARPVGALAMLLRARRLGVAVEEREIEETIRRISRMDVNTFGADKRDAYLLGQELIQSGRATRTAELFLREAAGAEDPAISGGALLALSEIYRRDQSQFPEHRRESARCRDQAEEKGYPEYMSQEVWRR